MYKATARNGLFGRLVGAGVAEPFAAVVAMANYPDKDIPLHKPPMVPPRIVFKHTNQFIDKGELTLDNLFVFLFGCGVDTYYESSKTALVANDWPSPGRARIPAPAPTSAAV